MGLCMEAERRPGSQVANWWWEKEGMELEGMQMEEWEAEQDEGGVIRTGQRRIHTTNYVGGYSIKSNPRDEA